MSNPLLQNLLRPLVLAVALLLLACGVGCDSSPANAPVTTGLDIGSVDLVIDFGPGEKRNIEVAVPCSEKSTVFSILDRAQKMGDLKFVSAGSGDTTFVKSIGSVENEGAGGSNWIFLVNDETGDKSAGIFSVKPADVVKWRFGTPPDELTQ